MKCWNSTVCRNFVMENPFIIKPFISSFFQVHVQLFIQLQLESLYMTWSVAAFCLLFVSWKEDYNSLLHLLHEKLREQNTHTKLNNHKVSKFEDVSHMYNNCLNLLKKWPGKGIFFWLMVLWQYFGTPW